MTDPRSGPVCPLGRLAPILLGLACAPARVRTDSGVAVGNPGNLRLALAPGDGVQFEDARVTVSELSLIGCDRRWQQVVADAELPLDPTQPLLVPAGEWCGVVLFEAALSAEVVVDGLRSRPDPLALWTVELWGDTAAAPGTDLALWLGSPGWTDRSTIDAWTDPVAPTDEREELAEDLVYDSVLVADPDRDGPDDDDPEVAWADPDLAELDLEDDPGDGGEGRVVRESGCGTETETVQALALFAVFLGGLGTRGRRREDPAGG